MRKDGSETRPCEAGREGMARIQGIRDPAVAGLALVRAAAAVLHRRGDLVQITPDWVEAYVRADRSRMNQKEP